MFPTFVFQEDVPKEVVTHLEDPADESLNVLFTIPPNQLEINSSSNSTVVNVMGIGEVVIQGELKLKEFSFSSFFWAEDPINEAWFNYGNISSRGVDQFGIQAKKDSKQRVLDNIRKLDTMFKNKRPLRMVFENMPYLSTLNVVIEGIKWGYHGGEPDDVYFDINFKEYRPFGAKVVNGTTGILIAGEGSLTKDMA